jgi:hypothetical protein
VLCLPLTAAGVSGGKVLKGQSYEIDKAFKGQSDVMDIFLED